MADACELWEWNNGIPESGLSQRAVEEEKTSRLDLLHRRPVPSRGINLEVRPLTSTNSNPFTNLRLANQRNYSFTVTAQPKLTPLPKTHTPLVLSILSYLCLPPTLSLANLHHHLQTCSIADFDMASNTSLHGHAKRPRHFPWAMGVHAPLSAYIRVSREVVQRRKRFLVEIENVDGTAVGDRDEEEKLECLERIDEEEEDEDEDGFVSAWCGFGNMSGVEEVGTVGNGQDTKGDVKAEVKVDKVTKENWRFKKVPSPLRREVRWENL